jgi:hypothetical protein
MDRVEAQPRVLVEPLRRWGSHLPWVTAHERGALFNCPAGSPGRVYPIGNPVRHGAEYGTRVSRAVDRGTIVAEHPEHMRAVPVAVADEPSIDVGVIGVEEDLSGVSAVVTADHPTGPRGQQQDIESLGGG